MGYTLKANSKTESSAELCTGNRTKNVLFYLAFHCHSRLCSFCWNMPHKMFPSSTLSCESVPPRVKTSHFLHLPFLSTHTHTNERETETETERGERGRERQTERFYISLQIKIKSLSNLNKKYHPPPPTPP